MKKSNLSRYMLFVSISTLLTIIVAIIQKSYSNLIGPVTQVKTSAQIKPIDPSLDIDTLIELENKVEYSQDDLDFSTPQASSPAQPSPASAVSPAQLTPINPLNDPASSRP